METAAGCLGTALEQVRENLQIARRIEALAAEGGGDAQHGIIVACGTLRERRLDDTEFWLRALLEARETWYARGRADERAEHLRRQAVEVPRQLRAV